MQWRMKRVGVIAWVVYRSSQYTRHLALVAGVRCEIVHGCTWTWVAIQVSRSSERLRRVWMAARHLNATVERTGCIDAVHRWEW
jgi:hypothetical protein